MFQKLKEGAAKALNAVKSSALALAGVVGLSMVGAEQHASAAAVDVTAVTTAIADTLTPIGAIGAGVLLVIVGIKTYKWVRRAM